SLIPALDHPGPLVLSLVTITLGILIYRGRGVVGRLQQRLDVVPAMQRVWDKCIDTVNQFGVVFSSVWQNGSLRWYFSGILVFFVGISLYALSRAELSIDDIIDLTDMQWYGVALCVLLAVAVITVVRARTRLGAAIALTATGFLVSLIFVVYRSPDILLTQILIETVSTIFILLVLFFMPPFRKDRVSPVRKAWNLAVSCAVGVTMFALVLLATSPGFREPRNLAGEYLSRALSEAGGRNAVNVIIVDFRAIDTTGEITVLVVVGLCIFGLLRARRKSA
ncbi:MAG: hydrogen gas-evolving membrane-bound hydrogenase subunit E, partial [Phycisphaeraceae bacterium]